MNVRIIKKQNLAQIMQYPWIWSVIGSVIMFILLGILAGRTNWESLMTLCYSASFLTIVALGQMLIVTTGEGAIDLSISTLITLSVEGDKDHQVFVKTFQEDLLRNCIHHIDFFEVTAGHAVRTHVRVELEGTPQGCREGGVLDQVILELEIECLPKDLPEVIKADVSALQINDTLRVNMLSVPETIRILTPADETIASVKAVKEEAPATDAAAADATADAGTAEETK